METIPDATTLRDIIGKGRAVQEHRPWPRAVVDRKTWQHAITLLQDGRCTLLGLWSEKAFVYMALVDAGHSEPAILSFACEGNSFPSVGRLHAPAIRLERALRDLSDHVPDIAGDALSPESLARLARLDPASLAPVASGRSARL